MVLIRLQIPGAAGSTSRMLAFPRPSRLQLEAVEVRFGQARRRRSQSAIFAGDLVRILGLGECSRPMRFEYREGCEVVLSTVEPR